MIPYDTTCGGRNQTISRAELGEEWQVIDPNIAKWKNFVDHNPFGTTYQWLTYGLQDAIFRDRYLKPATVEMMEPSTIVWNQNPYQEDGNNLYNNSKTIREYASASFSLPYYILRYFGYLDENWSWKG